MIRIDIAQRREGPPSRQPRNHRQSSFDNDGHNHGRSQSRNRGRSDPPSNISLPSNIDGNLNQIKNVLKPD